jgi:hypothetical protein
VQSGIAEKTSNSGVSAIDFQQSKPLGRQFATTQNVEAGCVGKLGT